MLRGPSGGGKTTLLNIIGTIDKPTGGSIGIRHLLVSSFNNNKLCNYFSKEILGTPIDSKSKDSYLATLRLGKIGFVFQTFNLLATMSAYENVELPMTILGKLNAKERKKRTRDLLACKFSDSHL